MQAYHLLTGAHIAGLTRVEIPAREPTAHEVRVRTHAASLNYRDLMFARGDYINVPDRALVPVGDGAGVVIAVGDAVTRFQPGDRVVNTYFPARIDGTATPAKVAPSYGTQLEGELADIVERRCIARLRLADLLEQGRAQAFYQLRGDDVGSLGAAADPLPEMIDVEFFGDGFGHDDVARARGVLRRLPHSPMPGAPSFTQVRNA